MIWLTGIVGFAFWVAASRALNFQELPFWRVAAGLAFIALSDKLVSPAFDAAMSWVKTVL